MSDRIALFNLDLTKELSDLKLSDAAIIMELDKLNNSLVELKTYIIEMQQQVFKKIKDIEEGL